MPSLCGWLWLEGALAVLARLTLEQEAAAVQPRKSFQHRQLATMLEQVGLGLFQHPAMEKTAQPLLVLIPLLVEVVCLPDQGAQAVLALVVITTLMGVMEILGALLPEVVVLLARTEMAALVVDLLLLLASFLELVGVLVVELVIETAIHFLAEPGQVAALFPLFPPPTLLEAHFLGAGTLMGIAAEKWAAVLERKNPIKTTAA
jgi:hypothetical protein